MNSVEFVEKMSYRKLSDKELEEKLVELQHVIKMREMPQNVGNGSLTFLFAQAYEVRT